MFESPYLIIPLKAGAAILMAILAVVACWLLAGRKMPHHVTLGLVWWVLLPLLWAFGGLAIVTRFTGGLGAMTNLSDTFPWGVWIGFDVLSGVALSAGGFLTAGAVYVFGLKKFYPILRPAILTAYLGYLLVVGGLFVDLGRPYNIWHPMIYWQHRSVMFEVGWCVTLYNIVLTVEFLPLLFEKFRWHRALRIVHSITIPAVICGIILSTLHQSSLGALFLIVPTKLWPITYSPLLPLYFLISAVAVGLAMTIVESTLSARAFNRSLEAPIITSLAKVIPIVIIVYLIIRVTDMTLRGAWAYLVPLPFQTFTFLLHMTLLLIPTFVLLHPRWASRPWVVFWSAVSVVAAVVLNRLNVSWFRMLPTAESIYFPSWQEIVVTLNLISFGVVAFGLAARYLPLFQHEDLDDAPTTAREPCRMLRRSLTAKILIAVGVTVALVIGIYTYFVIRVQSTWWRERTQAQNVISATLVREYLEGVMLSDRHQEVQHFLEQLKQSQEIVRGRIIDPKSRIMFSTETQEVQQVYLKTPADLFAENRMLQGTRAEAGENLTVVISPVINHPGCAKCHDPQHKFLGAIVLEKSLAPAEANIASNRNLLIFYGAVIFLLVSLVLWLLVVRLVSQPVGALLWHMRCVERGDLTARADAKRTDEIGQLEHGFNVMVDGLDGAKRELHLSHEKQIQQANRLASIGELASGIAHEIRNPLAGIGSAVEVLAETRDSKSDREIVQEIRRQIRRLNNTLSDLLDFARPRDPVVEPCAIPELTKPMIGLIRPDMQKQHIGLVEDYAPDLPVIRADARQVQQALLNLFLNALQAMPNGGTLTVCAEPLAGADSQRVCLTIVDTGTGITPENLEKIFSPFFTTKHRGTGLGLAITRTIIEKNHGTIAVESEVGRGTTFILEFAAADIPNGAGTPQPEELEVTAHAEN